MNSFEKLAAVRRVMDQHGLGAVIIPTPDPHQSEYVAEHWKGREWLTGFTGSAGTAVVTMDHAGLWTDSRYFVQAEAELAGGPFVLHRQVVPGAAEHVDWIKAQLQPGARVAIDGALLSLDAQQSMRPNFMARGMQLVTEVDVLAAAWQDRPALPETPAFEHPLALAGSSRTQKLAQIRQAMTDAGATSHLQIALDDIAWTYNLRGSDVECNPVFYAYALVEMEAAALFVMPGKLSAEVIATLAADGVSVRDYTKLTEVLRGLTGSILLDSSQISVALAAHIPSTCKGIRRAAPTTLLKACKTAVEVEHVRRAMEKDGVALLRLCRWLEAALAAGESLDEHAVGQKLQGFRAAQEGYFGESFEPIVGYGANGAIVHYRPAEQGSALLKTKGVLLLDSGGQYLDGTTDITRTFALGDFPEEARQAYTAVLRGHIAVARAVFPKGTGGFQLDPFARQFLWAAGLNYGHGTGHGVGYFLNVHEGPQSISSAPSARAQQPLLPGMITSNEPGCYAEGKWGIRIENLVHCVPAPFCTDDSFLAFETLTLFPIENTMIDWDQLEAGEIEWLMTYHREVLRRLSPLLTAEEQAWLHAKCAPYLA